MKILLLEDDLTQGRIIRELLKEQYTVHVVPSLERAEHFFHLSPYDIFIVDLTLKDGNGKAFCEYVRKHHSSAAILVLTGELSIETKVKSFKAGADDFLEKPFHSQELLARIQALSRRSQQAYVEEKLCVNDLELNILERSVRRGNTHVFLRPKEFEILAFLIKNRGTVITRTSLLEYLWEEDHDMLSNIVDAHIKNIREVIDKPFAQNTIKTIRGYGYKIEK